MKLDAQKSSWILVLICFAGTFTACCAQDSASPKLVVFGGAGTTLDRGIARDAMQFGGDIEEAAPGMGKGFLFEAGYVGQWSKFTGGSATISANYMAAWEIGSHKPWFPFITGGYTQLFGTGSAVNFGVGVDYAYRFPNAIRFEIRDYTRLEDRIEHNIAFRIGWLRYVQD